LPGCQADALEDRLVASGWSGDIYIWDNEPGVGCHPPWDHLPPQLASCDRYLCGEGCAGPHCDEAHPAVCEDRSSLLVDPCMDELALRDEIHEWFGFASESYVVTHSECLIDRGGYIKARLEMSGETVELYARDGFCSSGGTDCGWTVCLTSFSEATRALIDEVRARHCDNLRAQELTDWGGPFTATAAAVAACHAGELETEGCGRKTIYLYQHSTAGLECVYRGGIYCF
jgi:hypothetical protein